MTNVWNEIIYGSDRKRENNLFCIYNKLHCFVVIHNSCYNKYGLNVLFLFTKVYINYRRMLSLLFFKDGFHIYNNKALYFCTKGKGCTDDNQWSGWFGKYIIYCLSVTLLFFLSGRYERC